jgi:hypothetical protein
VTGAAKRKGDQAEREIAALLTDQLGSRVRRKLGAGRSDDEGDIDGLPLVTVEVKAFADVARGVREGLADLEREQANAGTPFGVAFIRRPGGRWIAVQSVEAWCALYREAIA